MRSAGNGSGAPIVGCVTAGARGCPRSCPPPAAWRSETFSVIRPKAADSSARLREAVAMKCSQCQGEFAKGPHRSRSIALASMLIGMHPPRRGSAARSGEPTFESAEVARLQRALAAIDRERPSFVQTGREAWERSVRDFPSRERVGGTARSRRYVCGVRESPSQNRISAFTNSAGLSS
jgi:hypothetical protein